MSPSVVGNSAYITALWLYASSTDAIAPSIESKGGYPNGYPNGAPATLQMTRIDGKYDYVQCDLQHLEALNQRPQPITFVMKILKPAVEYRHLYPRGLVDQLTRGQVSFLGLDKFQYPKTLEVSGSNKWYKLLLAVSAQLRFGGRGHVPVPPLLVKVPGVQLGGGYSFEQRPVVYTQRLK
jgi:hypothetical protein